MGRSVSQESRGALCDRSFVWQGKTEDVHAVLLDVALPVIANQMSTLCCSTGRWRSENSAIGSEPVLDGARRGGRDRLDGGKNSATGSEPIAAFSAQHDYFENMLLLGRRGPQLSSFKKK